MLRALIQVVTIAFILYSGFALYLLNPAISFLYLLISLLTVYVVLRYFLCTSCNSIYSCPCGFGKIALYLFPRKRRYTASTLYNLAGVAWIALFLIPFLASLLNHMYKHALVILALFSLLSLLHLKAHRGGRDAGGRVGGVGRGRDMGGGV